MNRYPKHWHEDDEDQRAMAWVTVIWLVFLGFAGIGVVTVGGWVIDWIGARMS